MNSNLRSEQFQLFDPGPERDPTDYYHFSREGTPWEDVKPGAMHFGTPESAMDRAVTVRRYERADTFKGGGKIHVGRLREPMVNTPDTLYSDDMANTLSDRSADADYVVGAAEEVTRAIGLESDAAIDYLDHEGERFRRDEAGVYYRNDHEDKGSTSVVVNDPGKSVEHIGTVGYEPEYRRQVKVRRPNPLAPNEWVNAIDHWTSRGNPDAPHTVLGTQFDWQQTRIPVPRS